MPATATIETPRSRRRTHVRTIALLLAPGVAALLIGYVLPMIWVLRMSVNRGLPGGGIEQTFTTHSFVSVLTDRFYWDVALETVRLGLVVAVLTVLVSYPVALFLARTTSRYKGLLTALAITPLLVSGVARTYGWMVVLGNQGLVNGTLDTLGLVDRPIQLSNNFTGVVIALVQIFMPIAILVMISGFGRLDQTVEQAAASLGANRWRVFTRVTLPLSLPGVTSAGLLVFVLAISAYVTPRLIGGGRVFVLATEIYDQATNALNWPVAAALSLLLFAIFGVAIAGYQVLQRRVERRASGR